MIVTQNLNKILYYAHDEAERLRNKTVEPEHLLLAIIRLGEGSAYRRAWYPSGASNYG